MNGDQTPAMRGGVEPFGDLARLAAAMCDGSVTHADRDRLERLLADPSMRREYIATLRVHAELAWRWRTTPRDVVSRLRATRSAQIAAQRTGQSKPRGFHVPWRRAEAGATIAACLLLLLVISAMLADRGWRRQAADVLARVVAIDGATWQAGAAEYAIDAAVAAGDVLSLTSGLVEVVYADGTALVLEGPASFEVRTAADGRLARGRLTVTLAAKEKGFAIQTPSAVITDIGTQFGVEVDATGRTDVRVFEGLVELVAVGALGTFVPARLTAGNAAEVDKTGRITLVDAPGPKKFVLSVPKPAPRPPMPRDYRWNDATAVTLYADPFAGAGSLAGSTPASRGGTGGTEWVTPAAGWLLDADRNILRATSPGAAFLPLVPEPGHIYRISVTVRVSDGGWAAVGLAEKADTRIAGLDHVWMLQRHTTTLRQHDSTKQVPNAAYLGPGQAGSVGRGDTLTGERTRTIVLDTTGPRWRALFFAGDDLLGQGELDAAPPQITHVAISVLENTTAEFRSFSVESFRP